MNYITKNRHYLAQDVSEKNTKKLITTQYEWE